MFGIDCIASPPIAAMKAHNPPVTFVCRYLSEVNPATEVKLLSLAEAKANGAAGISTVSNYEWYAARPLEGTASGVDDAQIARDQHTACGGPANRPIYFSVDLNTGVTQPVLNYFHGVASVIGFSRTGAYGSYRVIQELFNAGVIAWGWQTYAWSGGAWEPRAHIRQYQNGVKMAGTYEVDYNQSMKPDFGQWFPQGSERTTWVSTAQQAQALATWNSTTIGAIVVGGNTLEIIGIFPAGKTPYYTTGIALSWQQEYMNGRNWGPPTSYEFGAVDGVPLTDWNGVAIVQQNFQGGRCEWKNGVAHWYTW